MLRKEGDETKVKIDSEVQRLIEMGLLSIL